MQSIKNSNLDSNEPKNKLNAFSLAGLGIGSIVGSGFFLGSAISIKQAGPSVIFAFILSVFIISQVLVSMTSISINRPVTGSFKVYAEEFMGKFTGLLLGWIIYISNILGIASEALQVCFIHDSSCSNRSLMTALFALIRIAFFNDVIFSMTTFRTYESF
jgi:L-asparagine transporter-like permease